MSQHRMPYKKPEVGTRMLKVGFCICFVLLLVTKIKVHWWPWTGVCRFYVSGSVYCNSKNKKR